MGRSITNELLDKSKEAMVSAVQIYNNPLIKFKSEMFIITAIISWTYLMHAYYSKDWIRVFYQCIKDMPTGSVYGLEALARWIDPDRGTL